MTNSRKIACVHALLTVAWLADLVLDSDQSTNRILGDQVCTVISMFLCIPFVWMAMPWVLARRFNFEDQLVAQLVLACVVILNSLFFAMIARHIWKLASGRHWSKSNNTNSASMEFEEPNKARHSNPH
jgi:hypothetical protein